MYCSPRTRVGYVSFVLSRSHISPLPRPLQLQPMDRAGRSKLEVRVQNTRIQHHYMAIFERFTLLQTGKMA